MHPFFVYGPWTPSLSPIAIHQTSIMKIFNQDSVPAHPPHRARAVLRLTLHGDLGAPRRLQRGEPHGPAARPGDRGRRRDQPRPPAVLQRGQGFGRRAEAIFRRGREEALQEVWEPSLLESQIGKSVENGGWLLDPPTC